MPMSDTLRMALARENMSQGDLAEVWGTTRQGINRKFVRDQWSGEDLIKFATITGGKLVLMYPDGQQLIFLPDESKPQE